MNQRLPTAYVPHAGGPAGHVEMGWPRAEIDAFVAYWRSLRELTGATPKAVLVISAHWEAKVPTVTTASRPAMLYDYGGFPPEAYRIEWPVPGHPALAARVRSLLEDAGIAAAEDAARGYDHGAFVPLKFTYPEAVPVIQLSLVASLDPGEHLRLGAALRPLRDEGVFIVGSGNSFHNMGGFHPGFRAAAEGFNAWLAEAVTGPPGERFARLAGWLAAPYARACHPREEHLLPLMVVAGAAGEDRGGVTWQGTLFGVPQVGFHFGGATHASQNPACRNASADF